MHPNQAQQKQQLKAQIEAIEKQLETTDKSILLMRQAQLALRAEEPQSALEQAFDMFLGAQLTNAIHNRDVNQQNSQMLEEMLKQLESPLYAAKLVAPR